MTVLDRHYRVAGTSSRHLTEATMMMAPRRSRAQHVGYTDWHIGWSFTPRETEGLHAVGAARVDVVVTRTIPRWRPPAVADPALVSKWNQVVAAVVGHENGPLRPAPWLSLQDPARDGRPPPARNSETTERQPHVEGI